MTSAMLLGIRNTTSTPRSAIQITTAGALATNVDTILPVLATSGKATASTVMLTPEVSQKQQKIWKASPSP